jgi:hypothetical protein
MTAEYHITPVSPPLQMVLCIFWLSIFYVDFALAFGLELRAGVFGSITGMLVQIYSLLRFGLMLKWVDNFFVIRLPGQTWSEEDLFTVGDWLSVPWSREKLHRFATQQCYIGFDWNLTARSVLLLEDNLAATLALLRQLSDLAAQWSRSDVACLHGKLVHAATVYPLIRPFLTSASRLAALFTSSRTRLHTPSGLLSDLNWVQDILPKLPCRLPLSHPSPLDVGWWGYTSTCFGIGVVVTGVWGVWQHAPGFAVGPRPSHQENRKALVGLATRPNQSQTRANKTRPDRQDNQMARGPLCLKPEVAHNVPFIINSHLKHQIFSNQNNKTKPEHQSLLVC